MGFSLYAPGFTFLRPGFPSFGTPLLIPGFCSLDAPTDGSVFFLALNSETEGRLGLGLLDDLLLDFGFELLDGLEEELLLDPEEELLRGRDDEDRFGLELELRLPFPGVMVRSVIAG